MNRREFIATLAGAVTATSTLRLRTASAQKAEKVRRVSVLMGLSDSNPEFRAFVAAFVEETSAMGLGRRRQRAEYREDCPPGERPCNTSAALFPANPRLRAS